MSIWLGCCLGLSLLLLGLGSDDIGLIDGALNDLLLLWAETLSQICVELGLLLLKFWNRSALVLPSLGITYAAVPS